MTNGRNFDTKFLVGSFSTLLDSIALVIDWLFISERYFQKSKFRLEADSSCNYKKKERRKSKMSQNEDEEQMTGRDGK